jgi:pilus assembly protein Flp/PilA
MSFKATAQKIKSEMSIYVNLIKDTEGASGIEYAIIAGMVAVALATFVAPIKAAINTTFAAIQAAL